MNDDKNDDKDLICALVSKHIRINFGETVFKTVYRKKLYDNMNKLQPGKPDDKDFNKIAYNVSNDKRMKIKTGKFIGKKLDIHSFSTAQLEELSSIINLKLFPESLGPKILRGVAITTAYENSVGSRSCMTGECAEYTRLYEMNPDRIGLFVMTAGNYSARAVLWTLDNGRTLLDRVYCNNEVIRELMKQHAIKENWLYKHSFNVLDSDNNCEYPKSKLVVSGLEYTDGCIPYMDTLTHGTENNGKLDVGYFDGSLLDSQEGLLFCGNECYHCGEAFPEEEINMICDSLVCETCESELYFYCGNCCESYSLDDSHFIESEQSYVCDTCFEDYTFCDDCEEYYSNSNVSLITVDGVDKDVCDSCIDNFQECECGQYQEFLNEVDNGDKHVCDSCLSDYHSCDSCCEYFSTLNTINDDELCCDCGVEVMQNA